MKIVVHLYSQFEGDFLMRMIGLFVSDLITLHLHIRHFLSTLLAGFEHFVSLTVSTICLFRDCGTKTVVQLITFFETRSHYVFQAGLALSV